MTNLRTIPETEISVEVVATTSFSFACPACKAHSFKLHPSSHPNGTYYWSCQECSTPWKITVGSTVHDVRVEMHKRQSHSPTTRGYSLLKYTGGGLPQYIVVEAGQAGEDKADADCHSVYFYEEHTCPTNFLGVECISFNGETDPHGVYTFVRFVSKEELCNKFNLTFAELRDYHFNNGSHGNHTWEEVFPEMLTTAEVEEKSTYGENYEL